MASDLLSLISQVPSLISLFNGSTTAPYQKQQQQLAGQQQQISQALTQGPNNPLYQQLYGQYEQQNQRNLASTVSEAQAQNRMNSNLGRTPLFNQERGSENIFRTLTQGMQNSGVQADQQTRAALSQAGGQTLGGLQGYNSLTNSTANANKAQNFGYQGIYDLLRGNQQNQGQNVSGQSQNAMPQANYAQQMMQPQVSTGSMGGGNYSLANQGYGASQGYGMGLQPPNAQQGMYY